MFSVRATMFRPIQRLVHKAFRPLLPAVTPVQLSFPTRAALPCWDPPQSQQLRYRSNRSRRGLYNGKDVRFGNSLSFSMKATKRKFKPNVIIKRVYSEILDSMVRFHMTTSTLRAIDKAGGLDNYLFRNDFTEGEGFRVKNKIKKRLKNQAYRARRMAASEQQESQESVANVHQNHHSI